MSRKLSNGKISSNEEFICQHMCNHYRRILNAKKVVDTSPPLSYKTKLPAKKNSFTNRTNKTKQNRHLSPAMTDRSLSTNSYKASSWGTESFMSSSRYHSKCIPPNPSLASSRKQGLLDMNLVNQITYDTKNGPSAYCDQDWVEMKTQDSSKKLNVAFDVTTDQRGTVESASKHPVSIKGPSKSNEKPTFRTHRKSSNVMSKQTQPCTPFGPKFRPRILKTEAVSKLRSLRVYYPPRRRKKRETESSWNVPNESAVHASHSKPFEACLCSPNQNEFKKPPEAVKEQTSSRDSAYNGGVSSLPESRSPTPDHRNKARCTCGANASSECKTTVIWNYLDEGEFKNAENAPPPNLSPQKTKSEEEAFKKMKEDALYVKFIQDITVEVLEKGLFTNKAIKKVMRKHIINNLQALEKNRMIKEVENLRIQLGVPEDNSLFDIEEISEDSSSGILKAYPVISDSAFALPENLVEEQRVGKSISQILQTNEERECGCNSDTDLGSVIEIAKKLRERMPSVDSSSEEGNPNRKKRPKVSKFPKTKHESPRIIFSSSSSESEVLKTWEREHQKARVEKKLRNSSCDCDDKRNRSVTFDRSDAVRRGHNEHIQLIICSNNLQKNDRKVKAKND